MADKKLQKLELTWIGKGEEPILEPRILIENPEYSYGDPNAENMLIHGDNLLALKALEQDYVGEIKCIYIDPPYNTGNAFEHYDDGVEHSIWLGLMKQRLEILYELLHDDGLIFIQIDDTQLAYLQVLCDEIFLRTNRVNLITVKMSETSGVKMSHVEKRLPKLKEFILVYKKSSSARLNPIKIHKSNEDGSLNKYLKYYSKIILNPDDPVNKWKVVSLKEYLKEIGKDYTDDDLVEFKLDNASRIVYRTNNKSLSKLSFSTETEKVISATGIEYVWWEGKQMLFLSDYIDEYVGDLWLDISTINLNKEGGVDFPNGKKPEKLIERVLRLCTVEGDLILDSFLGSGSTAAVAQKMNRRYIGIEFGNQAYTHCIPRLKAVIEGEQGGISKNLNWQGGGGFKFYELAPSLLEKDQFDNWVISKEYNANMLAAAMAKQEGFTFQPNADKYWKQGFSSEQDFIYTTTQYITVELLDQLQDQLQEGESLLICAKKFQPECANRFGNISLKKIPQMLLGKCEFAKDDYSLNIINLPQEEYEEETENE